MWVVILIVAAVVISYFAGGNDYIGSHKLATPTQGGHVEETPAEDKCANCRNIQAWWDSLSA